MVATPRVTVQIWSALTRRGSAPAASRGRRARPRGSRRCRAARTWFRSSIAITCSRLPASSAWLRHSLVSRRPSGELRSMSAGQRARRGLELGVGHDARHEARALGARRVDEVAGEQQLGGDRGADDARQEVAHADVARREAEADEGRVHARRLPRDAHVGGERQREAAAAGRAVHGGDDRLRRAPHEQHELADRRAAPRRPPGTDRRRRRSPSACSFRSRPAQKARPAPRSTTTRVSRVLGEAPEEVRAARAPASRSSRSAPAGRSRVHQVRWPSRSMRSVSYIEVSFSRG